MKKVIFTLALATLATTTILLAGHNSSTLNIRMYNNEPVIIMLEGFRSSDYPMSGHNFRNIEPGRYQISVFKNSHRGWHLERDLIMSGTIMIDAARDIEAIIDRHMHIRILSSRPIRLINPITSCGHSNCSGVCHSSGYTNFGNNGWAQSGNYYPTYNSGYATNSYGNYSMSSSEFNHLKHMIKRSAFESTRESIARQGISGSWIKATQLKDLLKLFSFESTRISFAKFAYDYLVDPERFYIIYDAFTFSSSIDELERWYRQ